MNISNQNLHVLRRAQCRCGLCSIRLEESELGKVDPFVFLAFVKQAATAIQDRIGEGIGVTSIHLDLCWVSCRGVVRSLCTSAEQQTLHGRFQQISNWAGIIDMCYQYANARHRVGEQLGATQGRRPVWLNLCPKSLDDTLKWIQNSRVVSVEQVMTRLRVVNAFVHSKPN
jgi:hypothetical protein